MTAPPLLAGKPLPLGSLSPDDFQGFVYTALQEVAPLHGFRVGRLTGASGDGGFDTDGARASDGAGVCVQAKRYTTVALSVPAVALELAKVALSTAVRGAVPKEHYFITSGTVRNVLYEALRENDRKTLKDKAIELGRSRDDLEILRNAVLSNGGDVEKTIAEYIERLDQIPVWSGSEFDRQIGRVWSKLEAPIGRYFTLERVLIEHPRPDFDEPRYLKDIDSPGYRPLRAAWGRLPANLRVVAAADPLAQSGEQPTQNSGEVVDVVEQGAAVLPGAVLMLLGPGGAGKSTALRMLLAHAAKLRIDDPDKPLPILVSLGAYRGSVRTLIEEELAVRSGHWESLPCPFLLLCDGLNELTPADAAQVVAELGPLLKRGRTAAVLTLRSTGLSAPIFFPIRPAVLTLRPFDFRDVRAMAAEHLGAAAAASFVTAVRQRFNYAGASLFALPFGVAMLVESFRSSNRLPNTVRELVLAILQRRFDTNDEILSRTAVPVRLPRSTLDGLARTVAADLRLTQGRSIATRVELERSLHESVDMLRRAGSFGADGLRDVDAFDALIRYEVLFALRSGLFRFEHEIVAGYLVSSRFGLEWRTHRATLPERSMDEAWLLAGQDVPIAERDEFFAAICDVDLVLAAHAARECENATAVVESRLLARRDGPGMSAVARWDLYTAMAILSTPGCVARLKATVSRAAPSTEPHNHAIRALCLLGDRETLSEILVQADALGSAPGVRISGGEVYWWSLAPAHVALELARERVQAASTRLSASLDTIAAYGDSSDVPRLVALIKDTSDVYVAIRSYYAAAEYAPVLARTTILEQAAAASVSARITILRDLGPAPADVGWLVDVALRRGVAGKDTADDPFAVQNSIALLAKLPLPDSVQEELLLAYESGDEAAREATWQIATSGGLANFEPLAVKVLSATSDLTGYAANFAIEHQWQDAALREEFQRLALSAVADEVFANGFAEWRLIAFLASVGRADEAGAALERRLRAHLDTLAQAQQGVRPALVYRGTDSYANMPDDALVFDIGMRIAQLVKEAAATVPERIPKEIVLRLLSIDMPGVSLEPLTVLAAHVDAASLDAALLAIEDARVRAEVACALAELEVTDVRLAVIGDGFASFLDWPITLNKLVQAAKAAWSDAMLKRIVDGLRRGWGEGGRASVRESSLREIAPLVSRTQAQDILAPAMAEAVNGSVEMLRFWRDVASKRQRGD